MEAPKRTMINGVPVAPPTDASREITEPTDASGIAQKPVPERADPQQG